MARGGWTEFDDDRLRRFYEHRISVAVIAEALGRTKASVRNRAYNLKITADRSWSDEDIARLTAAYATAQFNPDINLVAIAAEFGRDKANVCRKARELGLTNQSRKSVAAWKDRRKYKTPEDLRAAMSECRKEMIRVNGHPRGMAGKRHSPATKARLSEASAERWQAMSDEERAAHTLTALKRKVEVHGSLAPNVSHGSWKAGWREIGGKRNYYRSRWEANYARYLEWLKAQGQIKDWQHEPETFWFEAIKRGVRSYLPDFRVWENDGSSKLHEVKGWMCARSKTTLKRMAKYHPQETIILIRERDYNAIARTVGRIIEGWESGGRVDRP